MKRYKLKKSVRSSIMLFGIAIITIGLVLTMEYLETHQERNSFNYVTKDIIKDDTRRVIDINDEIISKPYLFEGVKETKKYYDKGENESDQVNSLLYYKNTYMPNTGILYSADQTFDVISVLDGTVTSITKDEILGNVVEITHTTDLITIYQSLGSVNVKVGDTIKQNDVIGQSGSINIDSGYGNALIFEVNYKGNIINPNEFYQMKTTDLGL